MVIIVTGTIGVGKTTVCRKLVRIAQSQGYTCGGILTYKAAGQDITIEDIQTGEREILASTSSKYNGPCTPKYFFNSEGINFGIRAIDRGASSDILVVDEIGHLELRGEGFVKVIEIIKTNKVRNCVLVIRSELLTTFLSQFKTKPLVFEVTIANREQFPQETSELLVERLASRNHVC